eukprot:5619110-Karenia_brevis.AAC.1
MPVERSQLPKIRLDLLGSLTIFTTAKVVFDPVAGLDSMNAPLECGLTGIDHVGTLTYCTTAKVLWRCRQHAP